MNSPNTEPSRVDITFADLKLESFLTELISLYESRGVDTPPLTRVYHGQKFVRFTDSIVEAMWVGYQLHRTRVVRVRKENRDSAIRQMIINGLTDAEILSQTRKYPPNSLLRNATPETIRTVRTEFYKSTKREKSE